MLAIYLNVCWAHSNWVLKCKPDITNIRVNIYGKLNIFNMKSVNYAELSSIFSGG